MARLIDENVHLGTEFPSVSKQFNVEMFKIGDVLTLHNDQNGSVSSSGRTPRNANSAQGASDRMVAASASSRAA